MERIVQYIKVSEDKLYRILHHVGPGYTTDDRLPGPVTLNDLGPSTRGVDP